MELEHVLNVMDGFIEALSIEYGLPYIDVVIIARTVEIGVIEGREHLAEIIENVLSEYSLLYGYSG